MSFICTSCNGEIIPKNRFSILIECPFCQTSFHKVDNEFSQSGKVARLPPDMSFVQIGTTGIFEGQPFTVIGRIKVGWEQGNWNEWIAKFEDERTGWIADFVGHFCFTFPIEPEAEIDFSALALGQEIIVNQEPMTIVDIKKITYIGFEGELPFERKTGETGISIDLQSKGSKCAFIDNFDHRINVYSGKFVDTDTMALENIRLIDGW